MKDSNYGFMRVASAVPRVNVADVNANVQGIMQMIDKAAAQCVQLLVMPELAITGYTCADLLGNQLLLEQAEQAVLTIHKAVEERDIMVIVGAPLRCNNQLFNCAVVMHKSKVWVIPKTYLPNYNEFYEKRWFTSGNSAVARSCQTIAIGDQEFPFGTDLLIHMNHAIVAVEICEDLWTPITPSAVAATNGANVLVNISASNELVCKHEYLMSLIKGQSARNIAAYIYSSAGYGESTTDLVFAGNAVIAENGQILQQARRFETEAQLIVADIDLEALNHERRINTSFTDSQAMWHRNYRHECAVATSLDYSDMQLLREVNRMPFVPIENDVLNSRCEEIVNIQAMGLMRRLQHTGIKSLVVGISGGLDSTLALMIACRAFDRLKLDKKGIYGITMPGFGTTSRTLTNALELMKALGITVKEINIAKAVELHLNDLEHSLDSHDTTYENAQARERTQILMDYANKMGALVLGTGDLSELALGWCTYNGDHMSMYNVNGSIPKTLAKHLVMWFADNANASTPVGLTIRETLLDVLHTPISPELTPADDAGNIKQKTEDIIGPYELHDFFLYNMIRHGFTPHKIYFLARHAFAGDYDNETIKKWLTTFVKRFFSQQFKRSCLPDGPKVGSVSLSPRGDWRMPSDATASIWLNQCNDL